MESLAIIVLAYLYQGEDCIVIACVYYKWVSEANPILGCSIEISHDIYICQYVCRFVYGKPIQKIMPKCVGRITWPKHAHAQSQFWAVKTDL